MNWWNELVDWLTSDQARPALFTAAVLIVSIIVSAIIAASITKAAVRRLLDQRDRELRSTAIAALIDASTEASVWNSLTPAEQVLADRTVGQADILVRLMPVKGAALAANWAAHQLAEMKRQSATFGYELGPMRSEFRDRLIDWQKRPGRAKKIFENDLARWQFETSDTEKSLIAEQDAWATRQHHERFGITPGEPAEASGAETPGIHPATLRTADASTQSIEAQRLIEDVAAMEVPRTAQDHDQARDAG